MVTIDQDKYYEKIKALNVEHYAGEVPYYSKAELRPVEIALLKKLKPGSTMLDLGCGSGRFSIGAAQLGFDVLGVDITPRAIETARNRATELQLNNVDFEIGDMTALRLGDRKFDYVICPRFSINAVATKSRRSAAVHNMLGVVKPGGKVYIESFNRIYMGKGILMPVLNILTDIGRYFNILWHKIIGREYTGLLPGDITYKANKVEGASIGYAHLPTIFELRKLIPRDLNRKFFSIPEIINSKRDLFKYLRYSIWVEVNKD